MKTLYISDLDGTLLNRSDRLSEYTKQTLKSLMEKGMIFTYATARSLSSASIVTEGLNVELPVIVYNGAMIVNSRTGEALLRNRFLPEEQDEIRRKIESCGISPLVYAHVDGQERVSWRRGTEHEGMKNYLESRRGDPRLRPCETWAEVFRGAAFYYTCIASNPMLAPLREKLRQKENAVWTVTFQQELYKTEWWLEIMPQKATKAHAALQLKELLQCGRMISFGDAINDLPLFRVSDQSYAVGNAVEALKECASAVIGANTEDGVAHWLEENWTGETDDCSGSA